MQEKLIKVIKYKGYTIRILEDNEAKLRNNLNLTSKIYVWYFGKNEKLHIDCQGEYYSLKDCINGAKFNITEYKSLLD